MRKLRIVLRNFFRRETIERDLEAEVRSYADLLQEEKISTGMNANEAQRSARMSIGGPEQLKEEIRSARAGAWLETFWQDFRFGARMLRKNSGFAAVAIFTLALGIGANTAIFSAVQAVFLRSMHYPDAGRLVFVSRGFPGFPQGGGNFSYPASRDISQQNTSFAEFAPFQNYGALALTDGVEPIRVQADYVVPSYFELLGAKAELGRMIRPDENHYEAADHVVVISHAFWESALSSSPDIVGKTIHLNQRPLTVVGVMSRAFRDSVGEQDAQPPPDVWVPLGLSHELSGMFAIEDRSAAILWAVARLKPGVSLRQANDDLAAILQREAHDYPATDRGYTLVARSLQDQLVGQFYGGVYMLAAGSMFVLLIGCANVANLLLARLLARKREFAVRAALGAGTSRLVRQLLVENFLITAAAGALGLFLALWGVSALNVWAHQNLPGDLRFPLDRWMLAASFGFSILTGLLFGLAPAVMGSKVNLRGSLVQGGWQGSTARHRGTSKVFVAIEVAMAMTLLVGAGLLLKSFRQLTSINLGFDAKNLLTLRADLRSARYSESLARVQFGTKLIEGARAIPGIENVTIWGPAMLGRATWVMEMVPAGRGSDDSRNNWVFERHATNPGGLENLGIKILSGRDFTWHDTAEMPFVAVVSESLAKTLWPGENAVGKRFHTPRISDWITVIGIASDARHRERFNLTDAANGDKPAGLGPQRDVYQPFMQRPNQAVVLALRVSGDPASITRALRGVVRSIDSTVPLYDIAMLEDRLAGQEKSSRSLATLTLFYAGLALFLAVFGLFGVLASTVRRRTQEIGIRMALGARPASVLAMVLREGLLLTVIGICGGLAGAALLTRLMSALLFGVKPVDPFTYGFVALLLTVFALIACYIPARRAMRVDPMVALRHE